ncbi:hypothetical protein Tco_0603049 [Tanacetum coccineum]
MSNTANISDSEDTGSVHLPKNTPRPEWLKPILEEDETSQSRTYLGLGFIRAFMNWYCQKMGKTQADLEGQAYEVVKAFYPDVVHLQPLPLSGLPGHVTIQTQFFFNKDLDYLRYSSKGRGLALSNSKMKAARYHDFGLELLKFYIDRHTADSSRKVVRTHMRILSVVSIKAYSRYGYDYLKEITLRIDDYQEYTIVEKDFKNLYPSDFEDLNMLVLQEIAGWDATGFEYKHGYTIIDSPRAVVFPVSNNERKIMRFNEIYKFSDEMLTNILEALDLELK